MLFARVVGTVVATLRSDDIRGAKFLVVETCSPSGEPRGDHHVVLDTLQAGVGEMVLVAQGSSARQTETTHQKPVDAVVAGIVDLVDQQGALVYRK